MKLDLMVYGRGVERLDGYQLFAAPDYWTEEMLIHLTDFSQLWTESNYENEKDFEAWSKTYMFVCLPPPYCCALLHCVRVEGDQPNTWLTDEKNREIWSLEGWCCPTGQRDYFFPLLPSLILWMEQNRTSLYKRLRNGEIQRTLELPENLVFNPYSENGSYPEALSTIIPHEKEQDNWFALGRKIYYSTQPFQFLFGQLADSFSKSIGQKYQIQQVFSSRNPDTENTPDYDPMQQMETITKLKKTQAVEHTYNLCLHLQPDKKMKENSIRRQWGIYENEGADIIQSAWIVTNSALSISMVKLLAEAEGIRDFARRIHWEVSPNTAEPHLLYKFKKEE